MTVAGRATQDSMKQMSPMIVPTPCTHRNTTAQSKLWNWLLMQPWMYSKMWCTPNFNSLLTNERSYCAWMQASQLEVLRFEDRAVKEDLFDVCRTACQYQQKPWEDNQDTHQYNQYRTETRSQTILYCSPAPKKWRKTWRIMLIVLWWQYATICR